MSRVPLNVAVLGRGRGEGPWGARIDMDRVKKRSGLEDYAACGREGGRGGLCEGRKGWDKTNIEFTPP